MSFADHFSELAARYALYRPRYPRELVDLLADRLRTPYGSAARPGEAGTCDRCTARDTAWDAGCGSGQLSVALAARFARVLATDPSQAQLDQAEAHAGVEYRHATAEHSGLPDRCADLAVAAQAAHWFDWPAYVAEVARVARPGALAAVLSYAWLETTGAAHEAVARYYADLGPYWPPERRHVENGYRDLVWPWPAVAAPAIDLVMHWTREELLGYIATWSATHRMVRERGSERYDALCAELAHTWPDGEHREVRWPLAIKLARVAAV